MKRPSAIGALVIYINSQPEALSCEIIATGHDMWFVGVCICNPRRVTAGIHELQQKCGPGRVSRATRRGLKSDWICIKTVMIG